MIHKEITASERLGNMFILLCVIHTGNLWSTACDYYSSNDPDSFPLGLVWVYDKIHTDVFGELSCASFIATFSFFNKTCRNNHKFCAVL